MDDAPFDPRRARVAAVDIRQHSLDETVGLADSGDRLSTHVVDITDRDAIAELPGKMIAEHGAVDGVINVAGIIQPFVKLNELDYEAIERVINVNLYDPRGGGVPSPSPRASCCSSGQLVQHGQVPPGTWPGSSLTGWKRTSCISMSEETPE